MPAVWKTRIQFLALQLSTRKVIDAQVEYAHPSQRGFFVPAHLTYELKSNDVLRALGIEDHSYIPTLGHAGTALDVYNMAGVESDDPLLASHSITDVMTAQGFSRFVYGPIASFDDIDAAELALQAILFHEEVYVVVPSLKIAYQQGGRLPSIANIMYLRRDQDLRQQGCFDLFNLSNTHDLLCATDYIAANDGAIVYQQSGNSEYVGKQANDLSFADIFPAAQNYGPALALDLKISGYFAGPPMAKGRDGYVNRFYGSIRAGWAKQVSELPSFDLQIPIPPLVAVVLDRAGNRQAIPAAIEELRDQLMDVRGELCEFDHLTRNIRKQTDAEKFSKKILESFAAVVPESRLDRGFKPLARIWNLLTPIRTAYSIVANPSELNPENIERALKQAKEAVKGDTSLVDRTHTAATFAKLLRTDTVYQLLGRHFSPTELRLLQKHG
jgi:hypothetical protein